MKRMKSRTSNQPFICALAALVALLSACVDNDDYNHLPDDKRTAEQAITIVPQFQIEGVESIPPNLYLSELGLVVSEVRLTPLLLTASNLAYSTVDPMALKFQVSEGETVLNADSLEIPHEGRYVVSIRLEPVERLRGEGAESSFSMDGFIAEGSDAKTGDGSTFEPSPLPVPMDEKGETSEDGSASAWTPFQYNSRRSVFFTFDDVEFVRGEQTLAFSFDVRDWAVGVTDPISRAVRDNNIDQPEGVDVTRQIESHGVGVDALISAGVVRTSRGPQL